MKALQRELILQQGIKGIVDHITDYMKPCLDPDGYEIIETVEQALLAPMPSSVSSSVAGVLPAGGSLSVSIAGDGADPASEIV